MNDLTIGTLKAAYAAGELTPLQLVEAIHERIATIGNDGIWIHLLSLEELKPYFEGLTSHSVDELPLYGIPFAIKDNIDLAGIPTTAGCPDFSYTPDASAQVVANLLKAGAIPIGKANLDQFATGLVGTRSPYPIPANPFAPDRVPGGSSSGSAVAVSENLVSFSLGTDTAGSGRVPAAFNGIWGLKPSLGRLSTTGLVPACRTLDCISIFANSAGDCATVQDIAGGYDAADPYSRACAEKRPIRTGKIGIPRKEDLMFFGDAGYDMAWKASIENLRSMGWQIVEIDFSPFLEAARLLYEGPWVSERYAALEDLVENSPGSLYPTTLKIVSSGKDYTAPAAFKAGYRLAACKRRAEPLWEGLDAIVTPTAAGFPTLEELNADPVGPNSKLGYYTNFMNLLDLCAVAAPSGTTTKELPFGLTWIGPRETEGHLLTIAATGPVSGESHGNSLTLILFGAHMSGLPLNASVKELGATFIGDIQTAPCYKMKYLEHPAPHRPGIVRVAEGGISIAGEAWAFPIDKVGQFLSQVHQPLGLGEIELLDGSRAHGFLCEAAVGDSVEDISQFGGWRAFL